MLITNTAAYNWTGHYLYQPSLQVGKYTEFPLIWAPNLLESTKLVSRPPQVTYVRSWIPGVVPGHLAGLEGSTVGRVAGKEVSLENTAPEARTTYPLKNRTSNINGPSEIL